MYALTDDVFEPLQAPGDQRPGCPSCPATLANVERWNIAGSTHDMRRIHRDDSDLEVQLASFPQQKRVNWLTRLCIDFLDGRTKRRRSALERAILLDMLLADVRLRSDVSGRTHGGGRRSVRDSVHRVALSTGLVRSKNDVREFSRGHVKTFPLLVSGKSASDRVV